MPSSLTSKAHGGTGREHRRGCSRWGCPSALGDDGKPGHQPPGHFQKEPVEQAPGLDSPRHSTPGSPQKSSWHSRQVRPPKPGMHWHCPVNCQNKPQQEMRPPQQQPGPAPERRPSCRSMPRAPLTSLQAGPRERAGSQPHCSQPAPLASLHVWGAQRSQVCPTTLGRHRHCPVAASHWQLSEPSQSSRMVPR